MSDMKIQKKAFGSGFTLLEIIIVVVILGIAALIAVPMFSGAADMQVRAAANRIAADLDYAKGLAVTHQQEYSVVFDTGNEAYEIQDQSGTVINHPAQTGSQYVVDFETDDNFSRVNIATVVFNSPMNHTITFDYLGSPFDGDGNPLNSGIITLQADTFTITVDVEPVTGYVTVTGL